MNELDWYAYIWFSYIYMRVSLPLCSNDTLSRYGSMGWPVVCLVAFHGSKKPFSYSTQLSTKFILLIYVKMPTIVGILTFISMINTTSKRRKARNFDICRYFSFYEQLKFLAQLS